MTLADYEQHIFTCVKRPRQCPLECGETFFDLTTARQHWKVCKKAMIECPDCKEKLVHAEWLEHKAKCEELYMTCECKVRLRKDKHEEHLLLNCDEQVIDCPNGCGMRIKRKRLILKRHGAEPPHDCIRDLIIEKTAGENQIRSL